MLDPITAIGLAASIISFVDFGGKLVKGAIEIHEARNGLLGENLSHDVVVRQTKLLAARLVLPHHSPRWSGSELSGLDKELCELAAECSNLADDLLRYLERVRPQDASSKRQCLWAVLKLKMSEKERDGILVQLYSCRSQLNTHMSCITMVSLSSLTKFVENIPSRLGQLETAIRELSSSSSVMGTNANNTFRQLLDIQKKALHTSIGDRILKSLYFEGMHDRYEKVIKAHEKTFTWIFSSDEDEDSMHTVDSDEEYEEDEMGEEEEEEAMQEEAMQEEARDAFLPWLTSGTGVFHISGKMGSGKSTLMKYLSRHLVTRTKLETWANGRNLVLARFFFWQPGSELQTSLLGLYRSLLHDVLRSCPELLPCVFPNLWKGALSNTEQFFAQLVIGEDEIHEAFALLVSVEKPVENHSFCFFIDGLDEYRTTPEYDYNDLVLSLRNWTSNMPSNVKMCVSSREYPAFMRGFLPSQRFRLHQITKYDMKAYTRDRLESVADADSVAFLTSRIVEKACGIFFWLALVVKDVREQLASQVAPADLLEILNDLPSEMNDLYRNILEMLSTYNRKRAYQTLSMLQFVAGQRLLDLEAYSFLNDYNSDPEFARRAPVLLPQRDDAQGRRQRAQNWLSEWCRGLVEASERGYLDYAHRSFGCFVLDCHFSGEETLVLPSGNAFLSVTFTTGSYTNQSTAYMGALDMSSSGSCGAAKIFESVSKRCLQNLVKRETTFTLGILIILRWL